MDNLTREQRRKNMQRIRSSGTKAELAVMGELGKRGLVYTSHDKTVAGRPDIVFPERKVAVFIDSDFWHGNPERFIKPKSNIEYWEKKIERNRERDREVNRQLEREGWTVVRIWEYDVKHNIDACISRILEKLETPPH